MIYTVRPISDRTAFTGKHTASLFGVRYSQVVDLLDRELTTLKARDVVIEVDVDERGIRLDGQLRNDARAKSPAVRLAFESTVGPLTYATDAFVRGSTSVYIGAYDSDNRRRQETMRHDWQHNLYAIAKSLEALRLVDRYGVTKLGEQYAGFKALPAGRAMPASHMTSDAARAVLVDAAGRDHPHGLQDVDLWKMARARVHPDRNGDDRTMWDKVEAAAQVLGLS